MCAYASLQARIWSYVTRVSIAEDGGAADFPRASIHRGVFVVVITLPVSGPRISITGPRLAATRRHLFSALFSPHRRRGVSSGLFKPH